MGLDKYHPGTAANRLPIAVTPVLAMAVPPLLPHRLSLGPSWLVPAVEALLLAALVAADRLRQVRSGDGSRVAGRARRRPRELRGEQAPAAPVSNAGNVGPPRVAR